MTTRHNDPTIDAFLADGDYDNIDAWMRDSDYIQYQDEDGVQVWGYGPDDINANLNQYGPLDPEGVIAGAIEASGFEVPVTHVGFDPSQSADHG